MRYKGFSAVCMLMAVVMCLSMLAGCAMSGGTSDAPKSTAAPAATAPAAPAATPAAAPAETKKPGKVIEIRHMQAYTTGSPAYDLFNKLIEDFNKANPDIKVISDSLPTKDLRTKITVEMAAGTPPEVSWCPMSYAREFMKDNKIVDWKPIFDDPANPEYKQWFDEKSLNFAKYDDGRIMMAPFEASIDGLFYNKEMFDKYGWQVPKTFDELLDLCKKCREKGVYAMVTGGKDGRFAWFASMLLARAGGLKNADALCIGNAMTAWDDPKYGFVDAMKKFKQLVDAQAYPPGVMGLSATEADQTFARGEAAMYYEGQWKPANFQTAGGDDFIKKVRRADFPAMTDMPNGDREVCVGGNIVGLIIANNLPKETFNACVKYSKAFLGPTFHVKLMETGSNVYSGKSEYNSSGVAECFKQCVEAYRKAPRYILSMDAYAPPSVDLAIKQTAMPGIISGEYTVEKAIAEVKKAAEDYMKAQKK